MRAREGDLIRTNDKVVFDVKGLVHPPDKVVAFPRYIPTIEGNRKSRGEMYTKIYNLAERFAYLTNRKPDLLVADPVFGERLCEVPNKAIEKQYDPIEKLKVLRASNNLEPLERKAVNLAEKLKEAASITWDSIGISGSVMAGLFTFQSDIDPLVYGSENCRKAYTALQKLFGDEDSQFKMYSKAELHDLFDFRSKDTIMNLEDFERVEARKAFQGKFQGTDYFVRFIKDWNEIEEQYGDICYRTVGYATISATIADASESLFTPCTYVLENVNVVEGPRIGTITEIASFRGRFCKQAEEGERVVAKGKVELVTDKLQNTNHHRIIIGNRPTDYMILLKA
jgi:predicted nucleotidyltransferase